MQSTTFDHSCPECRRPLIDAGDEYACPGCGLVEDKLVVSTTDEGPTHGAPDREDLGSYMGTRRMTARERNSKGLSGNNSKYEYLKLLSDFAGRKEGPEGACARMLRRVGEKLGLPDFVIEQARTMAKEIIGSTRGKRRVTLAAISAYSLVSACRVEGVASVSVSEILAAHVALGKSVSASSIIQLALESPVKTYAWGPEHYVPMVLARLSMDQDLAERLRKKSVPQTKYLSALRDLGLEIIGSTEPVEMAGRKPCALAASAVYSAELTLARLESRKKMLTQREIARCGDTAEYTVREQYSQIFALPSEKVRRRAGTPIPSSPG